MSPENIFEIATKPYGGRLLNQPRYLEDYRLRCNSFINAYKRDERLIKLFPNVILDFVNNESFNAFASKYQGFYIIGIHEAVRLILFDLFNRMLSHREVLIEIGDPNVEIDYNNPMNDYYSDIKSLVVSGHSGNYQFIYPKDETRKLYAGHLTTIAMDFIFEHELSHIMFGHVDYLHDTFGITILSEFNSNLEKKIINLDLQTLEMDADCTALARCCNWAMAVVDKPSRVHSEIQRFYTDPYTAFSDVYFSVYNTFKLFGDGNFKDMAPGKSSHPDPRIRQMMFMMTFEAIAKKLHLNIDANRLNDVLLDRFLKSEKAYEFITGNKINKEVFQPEYLAHHPLPKALEENWKTNMRNKLLKYSFKPLAD